jgi:predicted transcriptional regulator
MDLPFRKMREHRDLSQEDLANLAGVPLDIVQTIEDRARGVRPEYLERVYQALQETSSRWRTKVGQ